MVEWQLGVPALELVARFSVSIATPIEVGRTALGERRIIPITGGTVAGPHFVGTILPGGADVQLTRPDGVIEVSARYAIATDRNTHIFVDNSGRRFASPEVMAQLKSGAIVDPSAVYFRTSPRFETSDPNLSWLERNIFGRFRVLRG